MNRHATGVAGPRLGRCGEQVLAGGGETIGLSRFKSIAGRLPAAIGGQLDRGAGRRQLGARSSLDDGAGNVITIVAFEDENLPVLDNEGPMLLHALVKSLREFQR